MMTKMIVIRIVTVAIGILCVAAFARQSEGRSVAPQEIEEATSDIDLDTLLGSVDDPMQISREQWKAALPADVFRILRQKGTERPHTSPLLEEKRPGTYVTAGCKIPVFRSDEKFESGTGWPSFTDTPFNDNIIIKNDFSLGMKRAEVLSSCGEHLGHVFNDGPAPTGKRYCINGLALEFIPDDETV